MHQSKWYGLGLLAVGMLTANAAAQISVPVLNHSFESPSVVFADFTVDDWVKTGPIGQTTDPTSGQLITGQLDTGVFFNVPFAPDPNFPEDLVTLAGMDGDQAGFIAYSFFGTTPEVSLSQDLTETGQAGATYLLSTLASKSISSFGPPMSTDAALNLSLYYLDNTNQPVILGTETITEPMLSGTAFDEFALTVPTLSATDPAVGQTLGILFDLVGADGTRFGTFNIDNVQLDKVILGDFNDDGNVDGLDIDGFVGAVSGSYTGDIPIEYRADFNGDGNVDGLDIDGFVAALSGPANLIPEPSALALMGLGGLGMLRRRR